MSQYRKFGKLDWYVSVLGFGTMRIPLQGSNQAEIDELKAIHSINFAFLNESTANRRDPAAQNRVKQLYLADVSIEQRANNCIQSGHCENMRPQHSPVPRLMSEAAANLQ